MAIAKETILQHLKKIYPDGIIFKDTYTVKRVTVQLHHAVYSAAKGTGQTTSQWL